MFPHHAGAPQYTGRKDSRIALYFVHNLITTTWPLLPVAPRGSSKHHLLGDMSAFILLLYLTFKMARPLSDDQLLGLVDMTNGAWHMPVFMEPDTEAQ